MDRDLFATPRIPVVRESFLSRNQSNRLREKDLNLISARFCYANVDMADAVEVEGEGTVVPLSFRFTCPSPSYDGTQLTIEWGDASVEVVTIADAIASATHYYRSSGMFPIRVRGEYAVVSGIQMNLSGETPAVVRFDLSGLTKFPLLTVLNVNGIRTVISGGMKALADVNSSNGIVSLYLSGIRSFLGTTLKGVSEIDALCYLYCSNSNIRGNISELALLEGFREIDLEGTQVVGNLTSLGGTASEALRKFNIVDTAIEGDVVNLAGYLMMTDLRMDGSAIEGDSADLATLVALQFFYAHGCVTLIGSAETMTAAMDKLLLLDLGGTQVTGDLAAIIAATPLNTYLDISGSLIAGDVADLIDMAAADGYQFILDGCGVNNYTDGGDWSGHGGWDMSLKDLGLTEAMVDDILEDMAGTLAVHASGTLTLNTGNITTGDSVTIDDGQGIEETFELDEGTQALGSVIFQDIVGNRANPSDTETLTIDDGVKDPVVFEFDDNASVLPGHVAVAITPGAVAVHASGTIEYDTYANGNKVSVEDGIVYGISLPPIDFQVDHGNRPTGQIVLADIPAAGATITIDDGVNPALTYEFDDGGGIIPGNVEVVIAGTLALTRDSLAAAIALASSSDVSEVFVSSTPGDGTVNLANNFHSEDGNNAITFVGANISVTGLVNGAAPGANVTPGNVLIAVTRSKADVIDASDVMAALNTAINDTDLQVTSEIDGADDEKLNLTHDVAGDYTCPLYETGTTFVTSGIGGGSDSTIGDATCTALRNAIDAEVALGHLDFDAAGGRFNICSLKNLAYLEAGNVLMATTSANLLLDGMAGGVDPGDNVSAPNIPVVMTANEQETTSNLCDAINLSALDIDALVRELSPLVIDLVNQHGGSDGNVAITEEGTSITATGMENGTDDGVIDPCYIDLSGNAVPSATGLAAMAALEINGWTVVVEEA